MTNEQLQQLVQEISLTYFKRPFLHRAYFNQRLKTTGGRYHLNTHHIDINKKVLDVFGMDELVGVIKHELCHYHLHLLQKGYQHKDKDFKALLKQVGGSRYVKNVQLEYWHLVYQCTGCGIKMTRKRHFNTMKYVCAICQSRFLKL